MTTTDFSATPHVPSVGEWNKAVASYRHASFKRSLWQIANSFVPFFVVYLAMYWLFSISAWLIVPLALLAGGFLIRIFIIFHDCGHGSFFKSHKANHVLGSICGVLTWTPYFQWRHHHAVHHATSGDLDRRVGGELLPLTIAKYAKVSGNLLTLTVNEYKQLSRWEKIVYRGYRNPLILFVFIPTLLFVVLNRTSDEGVGKRERQSVWGTNLALVLWCALFIWLFGFWAFVAVQGSILVITSALGVWLFYVQHQFEETYWEHHEDWSYTEAALEGSSFYQLPKVLQWFTGNIGFHHIHHLSPRIPNYYLEECYAKNPMFQDANVLTLRESLSTIWVKLWDEDQKKMIGFADVK